MSECKGCGARVFYVKTERGKYVPLNAQPDPKGNIVILDGLACVFRPFLLFETTEPRYTSHFSTCPKAAEKVYGLLKKLRKNRKKRELLQIADVAHTLAKELP